MVNRSRIIVTNNCKHWQQVKCNVSQQDLQIPILNTHLDVETKRISI